MEFPFIPLIVLANWVILCYLAPIKGTRFHSIEWFFLFKRHLSKEVPWTSASDPKSCKKRSWTREDGGAFLKAGGGDNEDKEVSKKLKGGQLPYLKLTAKASLEKEIPIGNHHF